MISPNRTRSQRSAEHDDRTRAASELFPAPSCKRYQTSADKHHCGGFGDRLDRHGTDLTVEKKGRSEKHCQKRYQHSVGQHISQKYFYHHASYQAKQAKPPTKWQLGSLRIMKQYRPIFSPIGYAFLARIPERRHVETRLGTGRPNSPLGWHLRQFLLINLHTAKIMPNQYITPHCSIRKDINRLARGYRTLYCGIVKIS
jgi:hypothetical protein